MSKSSWRRKHDACLALAGDEGATEAERVNAQQAAERIERNHLQPIIRESSATKASKRDFLDWVSGMFDETEAINRHCR